MRAADFVTLIIATAISTAIVLGAAIYNSTAPVTFADRFAPAIPLVKAHAPEPRSHFDGYSYPWPYRLSATRV